MEDFCILDGILVDFFFVKSEVMMIWVSLFFWYDSNYCVLLWCINLYFCLENFFYSVDGVGEICKEEFGVGVMNDVLFFGVLCRDFMYNVVN